MRNQQKGAKGTCMIQVWNMYVPTKLEQNDEKAWFFAYWCRFIKIKSWLKTIRVGVIKNGCGHSGLRTLKLAVSQEGINGVSWFLVCW